MDIRKQMDRIYGETPLDQIPWNRSEPPQVLTEMVQSGQIKPCTVVDLGCGAGNYAVWLAGQGFDVTGLDISSKALDYAEKLAAKTGVSCRFEAVDLLGDVSAYRGKFDLAIDWEVLHHIFPDDRPDFVRNVHDMLKPGGDYISLCFSEENPAFGGKGKFRKTPLGTILYFSSEEELKDLFEVHFTIRKLKTIQIPGSRGLHAAILARLRKV